LQSILSNLKFFKKYPAVGRLVTQDLPAHGLKKGDRLVSGGALKTIHDIDEIFMLPATVVFFRPSDGHLTSLSVFIGCPGIHTGHQISLCSKFVSIVDWLTLRFDVHVPYWNLMEIHTQALSV
jgi:hypothetical protein